MATVALGSLLTACGGSSSSGGNAPNKVVTSVPVVIEATTVMPVINGSATRGQIYVYNSGDKAMSGLTFNVGNATVKSTIRSVLQKVGINLTGAYTDTHGFVLEDSSYCRTIAAHSSCAINFTTPNLTVGNRGGAEVKVSYTYNGKSITASQIVNYQYVNPSVLTGVNFTGSLMVVGQQNQQQRVTGFMLAGGNYESRYENIQLKSSNPSIQVVNGFSNGQEMAGSQVVAVEVNVPLQYNSVTSATVTPSWGATKQVQRQSLSHTLQSGTSAGVGAPLGLTINPKQNTVNYVFTYIPLLSVESSGTASATVDVINNGNAAGSAVTASATSGDISAVTIDDSGCNVALESSGTNSCSIGITVNSYTPGSAVITFSDTNGEVGTQTIYWLNTKPYAAVSITPNPTTINVDKNTTSSTITFTATNFGTVPLTSVTASVAPTNAHVTWDEISNSCQSSGTIVAGGSCTITGTLNGVTDGVGKLYAKVSGVYANGTSSVPVSYQSAPMTYTVSATAVLNMTPATTNWTIVANGVESYSQTYTVTNTGITDANITSISLEAMSTSVSPVIQATGTTCTNTTTLAPNDSCNIVVSYGPSPYSESENQSSTTHLIVDYHGGTPDLTHDVQSTINYNLIGNDSYLEINVASGSGFDGLGTSDDPFVGDYTTLANQVITITYTNMSNNYPMTGFALSLQGLSPAYVQGGTCTQGMSLDAQSSCTLVLTMASNTLSQQFLASRGGSYSPNISLTATWTTPLGFYTQQESPVYVTYNQPTITSSLSANNTAFTTTTLGVTGTNIVAGNNITYIAKLMGGYVESTTSYSSNCSLINESQLSCGLSSTTSSADAVYDIGSGYSDTTQAGNSAVVTVLDFTGTTPYVYLNPTYMMMNYVAPAP